MQSAHTKRKRSTTTSKSKSRTRSKSTEGKWLKLTRMPERGVVVEISKVGGLHHRYERRAA